VCVKAKLPEIRELARSGCSVGRSLEHRVEQGRHSPRGVNLKLLSGVLEGPWDDS